MKDWREELRDKIGRRTARVGVIGLGYVGLPLALRAVDEGFSTVGIDLDPSRLESIERGDSYLVDVPGEVIRDAKSSGRFLATNDYSAIEDLDVIVIAVPTPLAGDVPDLSFVLSAAGSIAEHLRRGTLISMESTTFPGTTEEILKPRLERSGLVAGVDFSLVFSPERIDPGNDTFSVSQIPKIVGGLTPACGDLAEAFYSAIVSKVIVVSRPREAEMAKLLENTYRQVNIALVNEFAMVAHQLDIDVWEVIHAAGTKPFGFQTFYPGIGIGGHCIAVDPVYLTWRIRELGRAPFRLVELAREVDESMPTYVSRRIGQVLLRSGTPLKDSKILVLGVAYKPDVADIRESRALDVIQKLDEAGAEVWFHDPLVETIELGGSERKRVDLDERIGTADMVVILTHHSAYDWEHIVKQSALLFDARGATVGIEDPKIHRL